MFCKDCQMPQIIQEMVKLTGSNFKANENRLSRFFDSPEFMVEDTIWQALLKKGFEKIPKKDHIVLRYRNIHKAKDAIRTKLSHNKQEVN